MRIVCSPRVNRAVNETMTSFIASYKAPKEGEVDHLVVVLRQCGAIGIRHSVHVHSLVLK